ncbi:hypothetical protein [Acinetobacter sp. WCHA55]|uniref:hypothetical protein n=1 Tax=Acinetobacter sp. WCHA55 TaxID=2004646 RepID=UPI0013C35351|nr:hypothetical protein [Acinetobacter sp. WCHA55]
MQHHLDNFTDDWVYLQTGDRRNKDEYIKANSKDSNQPTRRKRSKQDVQETSERFTLYGDQQKQMRFDFL